MKVSALPTAAAVLAALQGPRAPHDGRGREPEPIEIMGPVLALHANNAEQWDREYDARKPGADDAVVAAAKRDIDRLNRARHGFIEAIDQAISGALDPGGGPGGGAPLVTESPGMAIDRLSVLVIRLATTEARAAVGTADAGRYAERLPRLRRQLDALVEATASLLEELASGARRFHAYESLKLYGPGDPGRAD
jgi:hypothetical protein